jgi:stage II sporulation protein AA (anti-sigma F factor antagonist)
MLDPAELSFDTHGDVVVVRLDGEVDMGNADRVGRRIVTGVLEAERAAGAAALDLGGLSYVDSSGLRMLEEVRHQVSSKGVRLFTIAPESCRAHRLLALTGLLEHLATQPDLAAVLAAVDGASSAPG